MDLVQPLGETAHDPFVDSDELHLVEIRRRPRAHSGLRRLASDLLGEPRDEIAAVQQRAGDRYRRWAGGSSCQ
jgi:hypothetical protein